MQNTFGWLFIFLNLRLYFRKVKHAIARNIPTKPIYFQNKNPSFDGLIVSNFILDYKKYNEIILIAASVVSSVVSSSTASVNTVHNRARNKNTMANPRVR